MDFFKLLIVLEKFQSKLWARKRLQSIDPTHKTRTDLITCQSRCRVFPLLSEIEEKTKANAKQESITIIEILLCCFYSFLFAFILLHEVQTQIRKAFVHLPFKSSLNSLCSAFSMSKTKSAIFSSRRRRQLRHAVEFPEWC